MFCRRIPVALLTLLAVSGLARAQAVSLGEASLKDKCFRLALEMDLSGAIKFQQDGKQVSMKQSAQARHEFLERVLDAGPAGLPDRAARWYQAASARIDAGKESSERKFRDDRTLMMVQRMKDKVRAFAKSPLSREELELTEHFDTLSLPGLLPCNEVKPGETWKLSSAAVQALCDLDGLIEHDLSGKLDKVRDQLAHFSVSGQANGIAMGAAVKLTIRATGQFDLAERRIVALDWQQTDQREQGPISPAFQADIHVKVKRAPIDADQAEKLQDSYLVWENAKELSYADPQGRFELLHDRDWHAVGRSERHLVMRLMERGDFVAQVTIAPWKKAEPKNHLSEEEFKEAMANIPGWEQEQVIDPGTKMDDPRDGFWTYRLGASGIWNGLKAVQYFYLVAGPEGDQVVLTFSMAPAQTQKLSTRDLDLVRGISFPGAKEKIISSDANP